MALEGNLKDFGLADILQMIYFQRKTGLLLLDGRTDNVRISFFEGKIVGASSRRKSEANRLGRLLTARGVVDEETLRQLLEDRNVPPDRLAKYVYREGLADADAVQPVVEQLMSETVMHLFTWKEGHYEFSPQDVVADVDFPIELDTEHLLMEGLRVVDELSVLEGKLEHHAVFGISDTIPEELTESQQRILANIDGHHDVSEVIELSGLEEFEAGQALVELADRGVIKQVAVQELEPKMEPAGAEQKTGLMVMGLMGIGASWVIAILALLAASVFGYVDFFHVVDAGAGVENARFAVALHARRTGHYPASLEQAGFGHKDSWGREYQYVVDGDRYWIRSLGADGQPDTPDDIY